MKHLRKNKEILTLDKQYLFNNLWGEQTGQGSQSIWGNKLNNSHVTWGTSWNWKGSIDTIKSYAAIVYGWHWGWKISTDKLPIKLSLLNKLTISWKYKLLYKKDSILNICYDIWLSNNPYIQNENPNGEIMIWLHKVGSVKPIGTLAANTCIADTYWDLWIGPHPSNDWIVYTFIRTENTNDQILNINDFIQHLLSIGNLEKLAIFILFLPARSVKL
jgi:xyloglucan-specific endo-beta-1,4-glucanase